MGFKGSINTFLLVLVLSLWRFCSYGVVVEAARKKSVVSIEDLKLERQLKILNKPAVKSLQVDGDIVDCVDVNKQPAFDHPLLRSHKIQMKPSFFLEAEATDEEASPPIGKLSQFRVPSESCPAGTVPIRRTRMEDLINVKYIPKPHPNKNVRQLSASDPSQHYALMETLRPQQKYFGAKAYISVNNPIVANDQFYSMAQIWVEGGQTGQLNILSVGWAVIPKLYKDNVTRKTAFWTVDGDGAKKTGCFNTLCTGFVQIQRTLRSTSDKSSGNWWMVTQDKIQVGYWPKELMTQLGDGAQTLQYGGFVVGTPNGPSPPMGNGHFASHVYQVTAYFARIQYVDDSRAPKDIENGMLVTQADHVDCYTINYYGNEGSYMGQTFTYGGPGGNNCGT